MSKFKIISLILLLNLLFQLNFYAIDMNNSKIDLSSKSKSKLSPKLNEWKPNGISICTASGDQWEHVVCSDGAGGAIIAWEDERSTDWDIYAQRINNEGKIQWTLNGIVISDEINDQILPQIVSDGTGGAIIAWNDKRTTVSDIYVQRINSNGQKMWLPTGICICSSSGIQENLRICSDGLGGAIIVWEDHRASSTYENIYAQLINSSGAIQWKKNGTEICSASYRQINPQIYNDDNNGAIIAWEDSRSIDWDIYSQRINKTGQILWTLNGVDVCTASDYQWSPKLTGDGTGGAIIAWYDLRSGDRDIYIQRVNGTGSIKWAYDGIGICVLTNDQLSPEIISDGDHGAFIAWKDDRVGGAEYYVYIQKVNQSGQIEWTSNGIKVGTYEGNRFSICSDNSDGLIISWECYISYQIRIYAQHLNGLGKGLWSSNGIAICDDYNPAYPKICSDNNSGAIIIWSDNRNDAVKCDLYSQILNDTIAQSILDEFDDDDDDNNGNVIPDYFSTFIIIGVIGGTIGVGVVIVLRRRSKVRN